MLCENTQREDGHVKKRPEIEVNVYERQEKQRWLATIRSYEKEVVLPTP